MDLNSKKCIPCEVGGFSMGVEDIEKYIKEVSGWAHDNKSGVDKLIRDFKFKDFLEAMVFVNKVAEIAETEGHHPDIHIFYNQVSLELWTHAVKGLTENDFIVAAKISTLL